jgi:hypothetical protein
MTPAQSTDTPDENRVSATTSALENSDPRQSQPDRTQIAQIGVRALQGPEVSHPKKNRLLWYLLTIPIVLTLLGGLFPFALHAFTSRGEQSPNLASPDLSTAFTGTPAPKIVNVKVEPTDGSGTLWSESNGDIAVAILGGENHWLGEGSIDVPKNIPSRLWRDGKLIATTPGAMTDAISANGLHYGYTTSTDSDGAGGTLYIDGHAVATGTDINLLTVSNDGNSYLYTCASCGTQGHGIWDGNKFITSIMSPSASTTTLQYSPSGSHYCLTVDSNIVDGKKVAFSGGNDLVACSPNSMFTANEVDKPLYPEGDYVELYVNGKKVVAGNISNVNIDDAGQPSYINSNGMGGGTITFHGKEYTFGPQLPTKLTFSPNQNNLLFDNSGLNADGTPKNKGWYLNGKPLQGVNDPGSSAKQLTDSTLYIYRSN